MHLLVCIGGSITQGVKSGAVFEPDLSYPAIIAYEMGLSSKEFRYPPFPGKGGLPMNIEYLLRKVDEKYGKGINVWRLPCAILFVRKLMDEVEDYWERGEGAQPLDDPGPFHNLAVFGFDIQDSYQVTAQMCEETISEMPSTSWARRIWNGIFGKNTTDNFVKQIPDQSMMRAARRVLNPTHSTHPNDLAATQIQRATELARQGGIENLIINLGANNVLRSVVDLEFQLSDDWTVKQKNPEYRTKKHHPEGRNVTVYTPEHFEMLLGTLMPKIEEMNQGGGQLTRVFWGTVPPVTVFPICRGVGGRMEPAEGLTSPYGNENNQPWHLRYFKFYTRPWISDEDFHPEEDRHLTGRQIIQIDGIIAQYKAILERKVSQHNQERQDQGKEKDWFIVDFHRLLERLAHRRYKEEKGIPRPCDCEEYPMPEEYEDLDLNTVFLQADEGKKKAGGLIALDGVHPTTVGNSLVAQEVIDVMAKNEVEFHHRDQSGNTNRRSTPIRVDYKRLREADTLIQKLPDTMDDVWKILSVGDESFDILTRPFRVFAKLLFR